MLKVIILFCAFVGMTLAQKNTLARGLTEEEKQYILDYHNKIRSDIALGLAIGNQPKAARMSPIEWSDELAATAQSWADDCHGTPHDPAGNRIVGTGFGTAGQNMMPCTHGRDDCMKEGMKAFYDEAEGYTFDTEGCTKHMCSHYTQLAWEGSLYVGCGYNWCADATFARLICNYGPGGNFVGVKAYLKGTPCSSCPKPAPFCMKGLCATKAECHRSRNPSACTCTVSQSECAAHGGTFDAANCKCNCAGDKSGRICSENCSDSPAYPCPQFFAAGYCEPKSMYYPLLKNLCPKSCLLCDTLETHPSDVKVSVNPDGKAPISPA